MTCTCRRNWHKKLRLNCVDERLRKYHADTSTTFFLRCHVEFCTTEVVDVGTVSVYVTVFLNVVVSSCL